MSDQLRRVARTALQGFVSGVIIALANTQIDLASVNLDVAKTILLGLIVAGVSGVVSALHNYVLDPSLVPSLAPKAPEG